MKSFISQILLLLRMIISLKRSKICEQWRFYTKTSAKNYLCKHNNIKYKGLGVEGYIEITKVRECKIVEDLEFGRVKTYFWAWICRKQTITRRLQCRVCMTVRYIARFGGFIPQGKKLLKSKKREC